MEVYDVLNDRVFGTITWKRYLVTSTLSQIYYISASSRLELSISHNLGRDLAHKIQLHYLHKSRATTNCR